MKLKFGEENNLLGGRIDIETVSKMIKHYRSGDILSKRLRYAHFNAYEILELFMDNKVLPSQICDDIKKNQDFIKKHGLKIYLGKHDEKSCPENKPQYKDKTTTILCNTSIINSEKNQYADKTTTEEHSLLIASPQSSNSYLDQASICPPEMPSADVSKNIYDIGDQ